MDLRKNRFVSRRLKNKGELLWKAYQQLTAFLDLKYSKQTVRTSKEDEFLRLFRSRTGLKIHRSFWIGNRNFDFFIGNVSGRIRSMNEKEVKNYFRGLAIEIDGDIHNDEMKMRKDEAKFDLLKSLNIGFSTVLNEDTRNHTVLRLINDIPELKRLDTRARRRLYRNIHIYTLQSHRDLIEVENLAVARLALDLLKNDWTV